MMHDFTHSKGKVTGFLFRIEITKFLEHYDSITEQIFPLTDVL
jgi:hypothetical protein